MFVLITFCDYHHLQHFQATMDSIHLYTSNAEVQSLDPHKSPRQRCLGWGWGSWQRYVGGHTTAKQKIFRALPPCKERRHSRVKDFDSTHFLNSSILLAWQCLWNPKMFSLRCQVSTWRMAQHGGVAAEVCTVYCDP